MMCLKYLCMLVSIIVLTDCRKYKSKDGKLVLNPVELIDLIIEERIHSEPIYIKATNNVQYAPVLEEETTKEVECRDEETLRARKVWSRWSKWGACSVTCGPGVIARERICLAGRCSPGEREEQRRPCSKAPCVAGDGTVDDLRDSD